MGLFAQRLLAWFALVYMLTSAVYLALSPCVGSPWKAVVERLPPEVRAIRDYSIERRRSLFRNSLVLSILLLYIMTPI